MSRTLVGVLAAFALFAAACEVDDPDEPLVDDPAEEATPEDDVEGEPVAEAPGLEADENATVVELLAGHDDFSEFVAAIEDAGLEGELSGNGPVTVFAPTDEGFGIVPDHQREALAEDTERLEQVVLGHVADGEVTVDELSDGDTLTMLDGTERQVLVTEDGDVFVGSAMVIEADARAANGIVHAIDFVLPSSPAEPDAEEEGDEDEDG